MRRYVIEQKTSAAFPQLERFEVCLDAVRKVDPDVSVTALAVLIRIARRLPALAYGATSLNDLANELGVGYSTFLKHTDLMAEGSASVRGLGLIKKKLHPGDRRSRDITLTAKGEALLSFIVGAMEEPFKRPAMLNPMRTAEQMKETALERKAQIAKRLKRKNENRKGRKTMNKPRTSRKANRR